jgi:putative oxidoreductase
MFFGALGLITGLLSRFSALAIIVIMIGAVIMVHAPFGFFMNWTGAQKGLGARRRSRPPRKLARL